MLPPRRAGKRVDKDDRKSPHAIILSIRKRRYGAATALSITSDYARLAGEDSGHIGEPAPCRTNWITPAGASLLFHIGDKEASTAERYDLGSLGRMLLPSQMSAPGR
jgi:hypothetical protein